MSQTHRLFAAIVLTCISGPVWGQSPSARTVTYHVPAQPLGTALNAFAEQSGLRIVFYTTVAESIESRGLSGSLTPEHALRTLLAGTELQYRFTDDQTVLISLPTVPGDGWKKAGAPENKPQDSAGEYFVANARLSALATNATQSEVGKTSGTSTESQENERLNEVVVTGTHIRGMRDPAGSVLQITRSELDTTGYTSVAEVFQTLPQNFDDISSDGRYASNGTSRLAGLNTEQTIGINLRGLGNQSTLVLLNGTRRAGSLNGRVVDISAIPLSMIERIEIVSGGHSAIYGADAVAGVVNLVTRRRFDGAETQVYYGAPTGSGGGERAQFSQVAGIDGDRGGIVAAYDYSQDWKLDLSKRGFLNPDATPDGSIQLNLNAQPDMWRHTAMLSGNRSLTDVVWLFGDAMYTRKKTEDRSFLRFEGAASDSFDFYDSESDHYALSLGARISLLSDWNLTPALTGSKVDQSTRTQAFVDIGPAQFSVDNTAENEADMSTASLVADGPLFSLGGLVPRIALGLEHRRETFTGVNPETASEVDSDRTVRSAFTEVLLPLVESPRFGNLDLTVAGRVDDYSDFGSDFNPLASVTWRTSSGFGLNGSYSTAFRAPALVELETVGFAFIEVDPDPVNGETPVLVSMGGAVENLKPEEATTWSFGVDYRRDDVDALSLSLTYFDVHYTDRVDLPAGSFVDRISILQRESSYEGLINRNPSDQEVADLIAQANQGLGFFNFTSTPFDPATQNALDVFPTLVTFNNLNNNIAVEDYRGIDLIADAKFATEYGEVDLGLNATYTLDHDRSITETSPSVSQIDELGKPADVRVRFNASLERSAWSGHLHLNYIDDYANPLADPESTIESWATVDFTIGYSSDKAGSFLSGFSAALSIENLLDENPPSVRGPTSFELSYDPVNANAVGRFVSLRISKRWGGR